MTIAISQDQIQIIVDRAENIYPEECCGILLGTISGSLKTVVEVIPTANVWVKSELGDDLADPTEISRTKTSRYTIDPQDIFQATKRGRYLELEIVGFFHSHPDNPAVPSICDRDLAWHVYSYPIVSVMQGKVNDFKSWVLDDLGIFQQEEEISFLKLP
ncbi:M67 family metallopeptidase [Chamaesiphon sp. VAR_48_metabat_403]|uniref:M67 family metallopeptidase n=1 Tax=Chamaesiphon sp. VAR_48_metabat_403 TaxID=2964700 RepID=UPI00286D88FA|nr:M67 family metallopeptidase [Chamaesiphon sp. VAR_48_metabat_403]